MEHQENSELYLNFSRRELQILCKSNNLPANRSHTELAKSLASFFKKKNGSPSLALDTRPKESENLSEDKSKDFVGAYERTNFLESGSNKASLCMKEKKSDNKQCSLTGNLATISSLVDHQASQNGESTQAEEIETSECSRSQKSSQNNSKRSHSPEFHEEFHTKRHHSEVENKGGMMMNLRSTRTSAKEAICEQVVRPRRSTRLLEVKLRLIKVAGTPLVVDGDSFCSLKDDVHKDDAGIMSISHLTLIEDPELDLQLDL